MQTVLKDTIVLLCQNGLQFQSEFKLEALVAITVDESEVLLVSIKETVHAKSTDGWLIIVIVHTLSLLRCFTCRRIFIENLDKDWYQ